MNNKSKLVIGVIILIMVIEVIYFLIYRINLDYPNYTEAYYEAPQVTFIKWALYVLAIFGLLLKNKVFVYITLLVSIGMMTLSIIKGPLYHIYHLFSEISFWMLFITGFYLFVISIKKIFVKEINE